MKSVQSVRNYQEPKLPKINEYGLELARANLPHIAAQAQAGYSSVLTRHGKAVAMVVPVSFWEQQRKRQTKARRGGTVHLASGCCPVCGAVAR